MKTTSILSILKFYSVNKKYIVHAVQVRGIYSVHRQYVTVLQHDTNYHIVIMIQNHKYLSGTKKNY